MRSTLVHVPHSSYNIPEEYLQDYSGVDLQMAKIKMTDHFCNELFNCGRDMLIFPYSRLFCDVERFRDPQAEDMEKCGMGAVYTKNYDCTKLREVSTAKREDILQRYYDRHHAEFKRLVEKKIAENGHCVIIDGHSFYPEALPYEPDKSERADFCIGADEFHTPKNLVTAASHFLENQGYSVKINSPYAGSVVPLKYYRNDARIVSIMLEVNRKLYIDKNACKTNNFAKTKDIIHCFTKIVEDTIN